MAKARLAGWLLGVTVAALAARAEATPRTVDLLTFEAPSGWGVVHKPGSDHLTMSHADTAAGRFCLLSVYTSRFSSGDQFADFASEWTAIVKTRVPAHAPTVLESGLRVVGGGGAASIGETPVFAFMIVVNAGTKVATVLVYASDRDAFNAYLPAIGTFMTTLAVRRSTAVAPTTTTTTTTTPAPAQTLRLADLVGEWSEESGSETIVTMSSYVFQLNGSFRYSSTRAKGSGVVREKDAGSVTLTPTGLAFKFKKSPVQSYNFIDLVHSPDGSSRLTLLDVQYPVDASNMKYALKLVRAAPKATPAKKKKSDQ